MKNEKTDSAPDRELVKILACPACMNKIAWIEEKHVLQCLGCGLQYPVENGIPVMLVQRAKQDDDREF